jgi:hypothetical protein
VRAGSAKLVFLVSLVAGVAGWGVLRLGPWLVSLAAPPAPAPLGVALSVGGTPAHSFPSSALVPRAPPPFINASAAAARPWLGWASERLQREAARLRARWGAQWPLLRLARSSAPDAIEDPRLEAAQRASVPSSLARAIGTAAWDAPRVSDHPLCGSPLLWDASVAAHRAIALAVVAGAGALERALATWRAVGLLDVVDERVLVLPPRGAGGGSLEAQRALATEFGFRTLAGGESGAANAAWAVGNATTDLVLLLHDDVDASGLRVDLMHELWSGVTHLERGVVVFRLRGKAGWPAPDMPDCCRAGGADQCPASDGWATAGTRATVQNWLHVFCDPSVVAHADGRAAQCLGDPTPSFCFSSADTDWSDAQPVLLRAAWFNERLRGLALGSRAASLGAAVTDAWLRWRPPARVCTSVRGAFLAQD